MGWFYIVVRTYPFWAIPFAFGLITSFVANRNRPKNRPSIYWVILAVILVVSSVLFLVFDGQFKAVPMVHRIFHGENR